MEEKQTQKTVLPCKCGNVLHRKGAVYCTRCGSKLSRKPTLLVPLLNMGVNKV